MLRKAVIISGFVGLAGFVSACGGYSSTSPSQSPIPAGANTVLVPNGAYLGGSDGFAPDALTVAAGTTVVWGNNDVTAHTTTADDGKWNSANLDGGQTFSFKFDTPGTYTYHCNLHSFMHGKVIVQ